MARNGTIAAAPRKTFAQAAWQIVIADVSMSLDNVLAVAGAAREHPYVMIFGLLLSIALMGLAASFIARLLQRYRWIAYVGLVIILYVALKMIYLGAARVSAPAAWSVTPASAPPGSPAERLTAEMHEAQSISTPMSHSHSIFTRAGFVEGARSTLPAFPGLIVFALAFGAAAAQKGLSLWEALGMSAFVYAGSAQMVGLEVWQKIWTPAPS